MHCEMQSLGYLFLVMMLMKMKRWGFLSTIVPCTMRCSQSAGVSVFNVPFVAPVSKADL